MDKSDRNAIAPLSGSAERIHGPGRSDEARREPATAIACSASSEWLVDGYNVLHAILLGGEDRSEWWREPARQRLIDRASQLPRERGRIWLVFDGGVPTPEPESDVAGPRIVFTPSADDWIHQRARRSLGPPPLVVTADRRLAKRCRRAGARIVAPGDFVAACEMADSHAGAAAGDAANSSASEAAEFAADDFPTEPASKA